MNTTELELLDVVTFFADNYDFSKKQIRDLLYNGGLYINNKKVTENRFIYESDFMFNKYCLLRIGKKNYLLVKFITT